MTGPCSSVLKPKFHASSFAKNMLVRVGLVGEEGFELGYRTMDYSDIGQQCGLYS